MVTRTQISRRDMFNILAILVVTFDVVFSCETRGTNERNIEAKRVKRQSGFLPVIPDEVKEEFKNYAKSYLNTMVTQMSKKDETPEKQASSTSRARICAEVCQHRCLPSCEWSCCIKENIEEYRSANLVKPLVPPSTIQRKSHLAQVDKKTSVGKDRTSVEKSRENIEKPIEDGHECKPSCKRYCVPSCRFACCQPVQIKGVLLL